MLNIDPSISNNNNLVLTYFLHRGSLTVQFEDSEREVSVGKVLHLKERRQFYFNSGYLAPTLAEWDMAVDSVAAPDPPIPDQQFLSRFCKEIHQLQ